MTRQDFKQDLLRSAKRETQRLNYGLSSSVENNLIELIESGVERMTFSEFNSESRREEAEQNLNKLIAYMVNNAKSRNLFESIDTKAFSETRLSICPLWPFC
jgi:hypothetical protein